MSKSESSYVSLLAHPDFGSQAVRRIAACARPAGPDSLRVQYVLEGDLQRVRIPPPVAGGGRTDKLWAHTCFEAFIGVPDSPRYLELNFSPSGQWAAYRFDAYREGMTPAPIPAPRLALRLIEERLELDVEAHLDGSLFSPAPGSQGPGPRRLRLALATVVEDREGSLSYWAARHPPGRPDFHHPESFSLALALPSQP